MFHLLSRFAGAGNSSSVQLPSGNSDSGFQEWRVGFFFLLLFIFFKFYLKIGVFMPKNFPSFFAAGAAWVCH